MYRRTIHRISICCAPSTLVDPERGHLILPGNPLVRPVTVTDTKSVTPIENLARASAFGPELHNLNAVVGTPFTYEDLIKMRGQQSDDPEAGDGTAAGIGSASKAP
ncbi:hypothetical protein FCG67_18940 [Rhodococcus oryzae]|uniref:Uncharacterized protein n=1 Tax=Rhodococcus oryzae TaxID=2571143 RepID=A0ABY2RGN1_9NOCA|nr:hypothetical protein [Rhodococcus oryzae]TJZ76084.1 hypothetical protein FCG67_18940 [Rhodococcus oryzae]